MRRLASLPVALLVACTSPVTVDGLRYDEDEPAPDDRVLAIPDGAREPVRAPAVETPAIAIAAAAPLRGATRFRMGGDGSVDDCVSVRGEGFPALDRTHQLVAVSQEHWLQDTPLAGSTTLRIVALAPERSADELTTILPGGMDTMDARVCRALRERVRDDLRHANAELAARGFRPMAALPIEYGVPDAPADVYLETPARERPLQVIVQHGEAIARIPGVKVYERHAIPRERGDGLYAVHGDRTTGTVVLTFATCDGDSCTCDPSFTAEVVQWSAPTFAALDAHPCPDRERCRGVDYGF
ncbi:MAG TPA: hypothetical protein VG755_36445 [Nannocystaceae bacterium]|nr:hypothetical protein [Nannocystaceae bacterium]